MHNDDKLNCLQNFRVSRALQLYIERCSSELGIDVSRFMRLCVYLAAPMMEELPDLIDMDRMLLEKLASDISKTLVIHPPKVQVML